MAMLPSAASVARSHSAICERAAPIADVFSTTSMNARAASGRSLLLVTPMWIDWTP
jgi:hypothetical protein